MGRNANPLDPAVIEKERQVMELRTAGAPFSEIARTVGYADAGGAHKAFKRGLRRYVQPVAEEAREVEALRLDRLQTAVWAPAMRGNIAAGQQVLRIMERRARLLGLDYDDWLAGERLVLDEERVTLLAGALQGWLQQMGLDRDERAVEATRQMLLRLSEDRPELEQVSAERIDEEVAGA